MLYCEVDVEETGADITADKIPSKDSKKHPQDSKIHIMETKENQKTEEQPEKNEELEKNETETIEISYTESDISSTRYRFSRT